jgi:ABC-type bacteriocin/lantibiotic exporter with double-glycine peptidase domain
MIRSHDVRRLALAVACIATGSANASQPLKVPFIQQKKNGCGAASIAMVAQYWQSRSAMPIVTPSPEQIYQHLYKSDLKGILLADMKRYLEDLGFRAFTFRGQWSDVERHLAKGRPIIAGLKKERSHRMHFAVLLGAEGNRVWLNDPTRKKVSHQKQVEFKKQWELAGRWMLLAAPPSSE